MLLKGYEEDITQISSGSTNHNNYFLVIFADRIKTVKKLSQRFEKVLIQSILVIHCNK